MGLANKEAARLRKQLNADRAEWEYKMQMAINQNIDHEKRIDTLTRRVADLEQRNAALSIENNKIRDACALKQKTLEKKFSDELKVLRDELLVQDREIERLKQQLQARR
jgi:hypothetical protein